MMNEYRLHTDEQFFIEELPGLYKFINNQLDEIGININKFIFELAIDRQYNNKASYQISMQHKEKECGLTIVVHRNDIKELILTDVVFDFTKESN